MRMSIRFPGYALAAALAAVLIFGAGAVAATANGTGAGGHLSLLGAMLMLSLVFAPWAIAAALKISLE